jgi:hypothetical protein
VGEVFAAGLCSAMSAAECDGVAGVRESTILTRARKPRAERAATVQPQTVGSASATCAASDSTTAPTRTPRTKPAGWLVFLRRQISMPAAIALRRSRLSPPISYRQVARALDVPLGARLPLREVAAGVLVVRRAKSMVLDPADPNNRSAGSVFLSPGIDSAMAERLREQEAPVHNFPDGSTRVSASWLLKEAGFVLGEFLEHGVRVSSKQFTLVTEDGATSGTFAKATETMPTRVLQTSGVQLAPEPDLFGVEPIYSRLVETSRVTGVSSKPV